MKVTIEYFGQLREFTGREEEVVDVTDGITVVAALVDVGAGYGDAFTTVVFADGGALRPSVIVLVNEQAVPKADPPVLQDGDRVKLLTAIAGG